MLPSRHDVSGGVERDVDAEVDVASIVVDVPEVVDPESGVGGGTTAGLELAESTSS